MIIDFSYSFDLFKEKFLEKKPLLLQQSFVPPESPLDIVESALSIVDPSEAYLKVVKNAKRVDQSLIMEEYIDIGIRRRRIRKDALFRYLSTDASLVLNRIDLYSPFVSDICLQVSRFAQAQASANAYVSFGIEPATDVHWDRHDIFAVQLFGEKRWLIYPPTFELPLNSQVSAKRKEEVPHEPTLDIVLKAGDILYLPRGWWHKVSPVNNQPTFHLAVGAHTPLILDYLVWACGNKLPEHLQFRKSVHSIQVGGDQLEDAMSTLSEILTKREIFEEFIERAKSRERVNTHVSLSDIFLEPLINKNCDYTLQINTRYFFDKPSILINGKKHLFTTDERLVVDLISIRCGIKISEVLDFMDSKKILNSMQILKSLLARDVISKVSN